MFKKAIKTDKAPAAVGPYSAGIKLGDFVYLSGQLPIDPVTNQIVEGGILGGGGVGKTDGVCDEGAEFRTGDGAVRPKLSVTVTVDQPIGGHGADGVKIPVSGNVGKGAGDVFRQPQPGNNGVHIRALPAVGTLVHPKLRSDG